MRWKDRRQSTNVEDRRGRTTKGMVGGGIGSIILVLAIYFLGGDSTQLIKNSQLDDSGTTSSYQRTAEENELAQLVSVVPAETEDVWTELFRQEGLEYIYRNLFLYSGSVQSACGFSSAVGDDRIQKNMQRYVVTDSFTHGTSEQRKR